MDCKEIREMYKLMFAEYPDIVTVKDLQAMLMAKRSGLSLSEYLRQRALGYEPGGHPPKEVFDVLDELDEIAENCQPSAGAKITACADEIRDLLIGGN